MEKRYQIFISSTFEDLKEERQAVLKAILELNHIPAGMELFPAADDEAWELIKDVIDSSDYYVLIIGGRYGSLDQKGIGYTEKEYDYAIEMGKSVIPILHKNPDNLSRDKTETDKDAWNKLKAFRKKVESKHTCVSWENSEELKVKVILGVISSIKRYPAKGWVRADKLINEETLKELLELRKKNSELIVQIEAVKIEPPEGSEVLVQGGDEFKIKCTFDATFNEDEEDEYVQEYDGDFEITWNEIWGVIAPKLINDATEYALHSALENCFENKAFEVFEKDKDLKNLTLGSFDINNEDIETAIVQFRALGLMQESKKQRSIKDTNTYWALTPYGDQLMVKLRALHKVPPEKKKLKGKATRGKN